MLSEPTVWRNRSPGDTRVELPEIHRTDVSTAIASAKRAAFWSKLSLLERIECLRNAHRALSGAQEPLARGIALETGKPIKEARGEVGAVMSKFELTFEDAAQHLSDLEVAGGPHPARVRRRPRGLAAVVSPFNFPLHLGHGATLAHLLAGNPVLLKPSPLAAAVVAEYVERLQSVLPEGVLTLVQGGGATAAELCSHPAVRSICFTGSATVGKGLLRSLADDLGKEVALELGGKNAVIVCADAAIESAAIAVAEGMCLTAGQRCNATSRVLVDRRIAASFLEVLVEAVKRFIPGDPLNESTRLGPLINASAVERYSRLVRSTEGEWLLPGGVLAVADGLPGHYVQPAIVRLDPVPRGPASLLTEEAFCPILAVQEFGTHAEAIALNNSTDYGLTSSIFTQDEALFWQIADEVSDANVYANLPTTFSPSTLPFGGWNESGNRRPGGRGFIRFVSNEQAIQICKGSWSVRC